MFYKNNYCIHNKSAPKRSAKQSNQREGTKWQILQQVLALRSHWKTLAMHTLVMERFILRI